MDYLVNNWTSLFLKKIILTVCSYLAEPDTSSRDIRTLDRQTLFLYLWSWELLRNPYILPVLNVNDQKYQWPFFKYVQLENGLGGEEYPHVVEWKRQASKRSRICYIFTIIVNIT